MIIHYWAHLSFYCVSHAHQSTSSTTYRQSNIMRKATQIDPNKRKGQWILYHLTLRMAVSLLLYSPRVSIQATPAWSEEHCLGRGPKVEEVKLVMIDDLDNLLPILCRMRCTKVSNLGLTRACHVTCRKRKKGDLAAPSLDSLMGLRQPTSVTTLLQQTGALHPAKTKRIQVTRSAWRFDSQWPENNLIKLRGLRCAMETVPKTSKNTHVYDMSMTNYLIV